MKVSLPLGSRGLIGDLFIRLLLCCFRSWARRVRFLRRFTRRWFFRGVLILVLALVVCFVGLFPDFLLLSVLSYSETRNTHFPLWAFCALITCQAESLIYVVWFQLHRRHSRTLRWLKYRLQMTLPRASSFVNAHSAMIWASRRILNYELNLHSILKLGWFSITVSLKIRQVYWR